MNREDFLVWKNSNFTQAYLRSFLERRQAIMEGLVQAAGVDQREDAFKAGYCAALLDAHDVDFEELEATDGD